MADKDRIAALKEQRLETWAALLPANIADLPPEQQAAEARNAEQHESVKAIEAQIAELRAKAAGEG